MGEYTLNSLVVERNGTPDSTLPANILFRGSHRLYFTSSSSWSGYAGTMYQWRLRLYSNIQKFDGENWIDITPSIWHVEWPMYSMDSVVENQEITVSYTANQIASACTTDGLYRLKLESWLWLGSKVDPVKDVSYQNFYVYSYSSPSIPSFSVIRCNSDGTPNDEGEYAKANVSFSVASIGDNNTKALSVKWRERGATAWAGEDTVNISSLGYSATVSNLLLSGVFDEALNYEIRAYLSDAVTSSTNTKELLTASCFIDIDKVNERIAVGKVIESVSPPDIDIALDTRFRGNVQFDNPIPVMANISTVCLMENPISEAVPYNATTPRGAMFAWQDIIQTPSGYEILKNYDGTRNVGVIIPHDGFYRVHLDVLLSKESSSSAMRLRILQMPSTWALPTDRNYLIESDYSASKIREVVRLEKAWSSTTTKGAAVGVIYCNAGDKIVPIVACDDTSKDINNGGTVFSIQNIG